MPVRHLKSPPLLKKVSTCLVETGVEAYLVGGALRNLLLGRKAADLDITVKGKARGIARTIAGVLHGKYVLLDEVNDTARVLLSGRYRGQIDFTGFSDQIEKDLGRRDFTIGAMAVNIAGIEAVSPAIIDPFHGQQDLKDKVIRAVSDNAFRDDPLRLLRAVRLAVELGFVIEPHTEDLIRRDVHLVTRVAGERIREELLKILAMPLSGQHWDYFDRLGLVTALIPELKAARGVEQPIEHHWDVLHHSLMSAAAAGYLLRHGAWEYAPPDILDAVPWSDHLATHFAAGVNPGSTRGSLLKLAGLLHDIAKPETKTQDETGRTRFFGHPDAGATVAAEILTRLRFSTKEIKLVETMVKHHMRPTQISQEAMPTPRAIYRFFRDTGEAGIDTLFLSLADHLAARGPGLILSEWQRHSETTAYVVQQHFAVTVPGKPRRLVTGNDLIRSLKISPGPLIGQLLEAVQEATAAGELDTKKQAIGYARTWLAKTTHR